MFPTLRSRQYGAFICREAEHLRPHEIECSFLVGRPWAPWPLHFIPRWRDYGPANPLMPPEGFQARVATYLRPPGLGFRRVEFEIFCQYTFDLRRVSVLSAKSDSLDDSLDRF